MANENVMSPLFGAYDSRINDLSSLTEQQRMALDSFAEEIEKLVTENEVRLGGIWWGGRGDLRGSCGGEAGSLLWGGGGRIS